MVLILVGIQYELNGANTSTEIFARMIAIMNFIAMARFFETTCHSIFQHFLAAGSKDGGLFGLISTYFGKVETNSQGMLHLHCLVWFHGSFYITELCKQLQVDSKYTTCIVEFIDCIIRCFIIPKD